MAGRLNSPAILLLASASLMLSMTTPDCAQTPRSTPAGSPTAQRRNSAATTAHRTAMLEGEVQAGHAFESQIGNGLRILLEPIASGWVLRVVPAAGPRGAHDYAELATPPYRSVSPLLISTDFSFRAQDVLAWNPRHFRFATDRASFAELSEAYGQYQRLAEGGAPTASRMHLAESRLATLVGRATEAELTILDARLVQGTGDQSQAAALVAIHPNASARQIDQPSDGVATPLGRINWFRFRISIDLPAGFQLDKAWRVDRRRP